MALAFSSHFSRQRKSAHRATCVARVARLICATCVVASTMGAGLESLAYADGAKPAAMADMGGRKKLEEGEEKLASFEYEEAYKLAVSAREKGGLVRTDLARTYRLEGTALAFLNKRDEAKRAFYILLLIDPDAPLDANLSPRIQDPFLQARGEVRALPERPGVSFTATPESGQSATISLVLHDTANLVERERVGFRFGSEPMTVRERGRAREVHVATGPAPRSGTLSAFVQALDAQGNVVYESGSETAPRTFPVRSLEVVAHPAQETPRKRGVLASPIFWTVAGVIVVGAGTAGVLALTTGGSRSVTDPPTGAQVRPVLFCGAERCR